MVTYHRQKGHPVHPSGLLIINHVKREKWELYHEQIALNGEKLGSGEFGEVVAGTLSRGVFSTPIPVAIKTLRGDHMSSEDRLAPSVLPLIIFKGHVPARGQRDAEAEAQAHRPAVRGGHAAGADHDRHGEGHRRQSALAGE